MRVRVGYLALLVLTVSLAGCSAGGSAAASPSAGSARRSGLAGVLPVPAGTTPWPSNTYAPLSRVAFVRKLYVQSAWADEEAQYLQRGFVAGAFEGWINYNGSQESITVARFTRPTGAASAFDDISDGFTQMPKPASTLGDPAVGGVGTIDPTLDKMGNARVEIAAYIGDYLIQVAVFTAATPDPSDAKALMLQQYEALKNGS
jgi:hypothetical protein